MGIQIQGSKLINGQTSSLGVISKAKTDDVSIFGNCDTKSENKTQYENSKKKKIMLGIGIGIAIAGLAVFAYCKRDAIKSFFKELKINNFINKGLSSAREARSNPIEPVVQEKGDFFKKVVDRLSSKGDKIVKDVVTDADFIGDTVRYAEKRVSENSNVLSELFLTDSSAQAIKSSIELSGTGPTKIAQIVSNDSGIMSKLDSQFPNLAEALRKTKTECNPSRTLEEAMQFVQDSFPNNGYILEKKLGVGSIGATYLAKNPAGESVAIKMIKKGVSLESLKAEEKLLTEAISKTCSGEELTKVKAMIRDLYKGWTDELNLFKSLEYNRAFSDGAKRYSVAQIKEISKNGQCLVMEMADGIQMNKLMDILKDYKANPAEFSTKYADLIKTNPWLADPKKVLNELPESITKSFSEQFLFLKSGQKSIMHRDPHTGNFFITTNNKGKLIPKFIDTDNCIVRNCNQIKDDISMFANYLVGNSKKVAEYYVNQCGVNIKDKSKYVELVSKDLKKSIFNQKYDITSYTNVQNTIVSILKEHGLSLSTENSTALKSQLQIVKVIGESGRLSGKGLDVLTLMKDIPKAVWGMIKSGVNPFNCIKDALIYAVKNPTNMLANAGQFFV